MHHSEESWEDLLNVQVKKPGSLRVYFVLLQLLFLLIYAFHLPSLSVSPAQVWLIVKAIVLVAALLIVVTMPRSTLGTASFISSLTMSNAIVLFSTIPREMWTDPGMMCAV